MPAVQKSAQTGAATDIQGADSLGRIQFVTGNRKQINSQYIHVDRNFARGLHGVGVEVDVGFGSDAADFFERLDGTELIVGVHDGDENCFRPDGAAQLLEVDQSLAIVRQIGDANAFFFESLASVEDGFVFDGG